MHAGQPVRPVKGGISAVAVSAVVLVSMTCPADAARRAQPRWSSSHASVVRPRVVPLSVAPPEPEPEPEATETLADALEAAYRTSPALQIRRYELRASDEDYAQALSELRPTVDLQVTGAYSKTVPGRTTQINRPLVDRLRSSIITSNSVGAQITVDQPLYTGGRATADRLIADAAIRAGREALRGTEGDLFLQVISTYVDIRRDAAALVIRRNNLAQLAATLDEVKARREAGELTRTDIAQAETQLDSARTQYNAGEAQLEQDRSTYAALVGRNPGILALEPSLPQLPATIDDAFDIADRFNPDLAQAIQTERSSRERIAAAKAEGQPRLSLRGTAGLNGQAVPYYLYNEDQSFAGQAVLTVPLSQGGRVASLVVQAGNRNSADRLRIEAARRQMVQAIVSAWNQRSTTARNIEVQTAQLAAARTFYEGTFEEYRAGLRSTFDVLFAQGALRDTEIALLGSQHDLYVAEATLLRHIGVLEARSILTGTRLYDPTIAFRHAAGRNALPWDGGLRAIDGVTRPSAHQRTLEQPEVSSRPAEVVPARAVTTPGGLEKTSPLVPLGGTVGNPAIRKPQ